MFYLGSLTNHSVATCGNVYSALHQSSHCSSIVPIQSLRYRSSIDIVIIPAAVTEVLLIGSLFLRCLFWLTCGVDFVSSWCFGLLHDEFTCKRTVNETYLTSVVSMMTHAP